MKMNTNINTVARFLISFFYIAGGFRLMDMVHQIDLTTVFSFSNLLFAVGCIEVVSGLFLFLGYKKSGSAILLVICTLLTILFLSDGFFELLNHVAHAAALFLIIINDSGVTILEYAQTDIDDLPDYKVKM